MSAGYHKRLKASQGNDINSNQWVLRKDNKQGLEDLIFEILFPRIKVNAYFEHSFYHSRRNIIILNTYINDNFSETYQDESRWIPTFNV